MFVKESKIKLETVAPALSAVAIVSTIGYLAYNYRVELIQGSLNGAQFALQGSDLLLMSLVGSIGALLLVLVVNLSTASSDF